MDVVYRHGAGLLIGSVLGIAVAFAPTAVAAQDSRVPATDATSLPTGHSFAYYGIGDPIQQKASMRAILADRELDRVRQVTGVADAAGYFVLKMVFGGTSASNDLAETRPDVRDLLGNE